MKIKITNINEMEKLFKNSKISKTTLWRGKKRGYLYLNYHKKDIGNEKLIEEKTIALYYYTYKIVGIYLNRYMRTYLDRYNFKQIQGDIAGDVFIDLYERKKEEVFKYVNNKAKEYMLRKKAYYRKYISGEVDLEGILPTTKDINDFIS